MLYYLGIDIGSGNSKGVLANDDRIIARATVRSGVNYKLAARQLRDQLLAEGKLATADLKYTVATGTGSAMVEYANAQVADMRCCARGMNRLAADVRTIMDIQGQSTQAMRINAQGQIVNFVTSEKCASGAGRFLDIISNVLQVPLEQMGPVSLRSQNPVTFSTGCAVFGESEAVSRVAEGVSKEDILAGVHRALAEKIVSLVDRVGREPVFAICGGGALNIGLVEWVRRKLGTDIFVPEYPQYVTAEGAAVFARELSKQ